MKKLNSRFSLLFIGLMVILNTINANVSSKTPNYLKTQFAGNIGFISFGYGKAFQKQHLSTDINYGYISEKVNGVRIHSFALRSSWCFYRAHILSIKTGLYSGISMVYSITKNTYLKYPDYYPSNYYYPNAIHINPFIGSMISVPVKSEKIDTASFFVELGSVDYQMQSALRNSRISIEDIINLSFGFGILLK